MAILNDDLDSVLLARDNIKTAIINKGQTVGNDLRTYAEAVSKIQTGIDTSDATATADDIINPKTAYVQGQKVTGSIIPTYSSSGVAKYTQTNINMKIFLQDDTELLTSITIVDYDYENGFLFISYTYNSLNYISLCIRISDNNFKIIDAFNSDDILTIKSNSSSGSIYSEENKIYCFCLVNIERSASTNLSLYCTVYDKQTSSFTHKYICSISNGGYIFAYNKNTIYQQDYGSSRRYNLSDSLDYVNYETLASTGESLYNRDYQVIFSNDRKWLNMKLYARYSSSDRNIIVNLATKNYISIYTYDQCLAFINNDLYVVIGTDGSIAVHQCIDGTTLKSFISDTVKNLNIRSYRRLWK